MNRKRIWLVPALVTAAFAAPAHAQTAATGDVARHAGLGGGGVALQGPRASSRINPAALASRTGIRINLPRIAVGVQGEKGPAALANIIENADFDHLLDIGPGLLRDRTVAWTDLDQSLRFNHFEIGLSGGGQLEGTPNAPLMRFARGANFNDIDELDNLPRSARFKAEFGYHAALNLAYGHRFKIPGQAAGDLDVGVRITPVIGNYERSVFRPNRARDRVIEDRQADVDGFGVGLDLGLRYSPATSREWSYGLVARGLSEGAIGNMKRPRTFDLGVANQLSRRLTLVADLTNGPGVESRSRKFGVGAEYVAWRFITVRGAVTTRGLAFGFDLGPVSFAFARDGEALLGTGISF